MVRAGLISKSDAKNSKENPITEKEEINLKEYILDKLDISKMNLKHLKMKIKIFEILRHIIIF